MSVMRLRLRTERTVRMKCTDHNARSVQTRRHGCRRSGLRVYFNRRRDSTLRTFLIFSVLIFYAARQAPSSVRVYYLVPYKAVQMAETVCTVLLELS